MQGCRGRAKAKSSENIFHQSILSALSFEFIRQIILSNVYIIINATNEIIISCSKSCFPNKKQIKKTKHDIYIKIFK